MAGPSEAPSAHPDPWRTAIPTAEEVHSGSSERGYPKFRAAAEAEAEDEEEQVGTSTAAAPPCRWTAAA